MTLHDRLDDRTNHITFIRLVLALLVIFSHSFALGGFGNELILGGNDKYGNLAVNAFFVISGLLVTASYVRSRSIRRFVWNRFLRIMPGFWVALAVTAFVICPVALWLHDGNLAAWFSPTGASPLGYVARNALLRIQQDHIGALFASNPYPRVVNGVLWTLGYEVLCYGFVLMAGLLGMLRKHRGWPVALTALAIMNGLVHAGVEDYLPGDFHQILALLHFLSYFVAGMMAYIYADKIGIRVRNTVAATGLLLLLLAVRSPVAFYPYHLIAPVLLVYVIFGAAYGTAETAFERRMPDISYGLYIYGWVIQQSLVFNNAATESAGSLFGASVLVTSVLALLSYYLIERPCLKLKTAV